MTAATDIDDIDDIDIDDLPTDVNSLAQLRSAIDAGIGALAAQAEQIDQMKGTFDDSDGAIERALEDNAHAATYLENGRAYLDRIIKPLANPGERSLDMPEAAVILALHDDLAQELAAASEENIGEIDELQDAEITLSSATTEHLLDVLVGAARAATLAAEPIEIAIHVDGGAVQGVTRPDDETRPVHVYVHDHDLDGHESDPDEDPELGHITFENAKDESDIDACNLAVHSGGRWEVAPRNGKYWTSLRSEANRLGLLD